VFREDPTFGWPRQIGRFVPRCGFRCRGHPPDHAVQQGAL